MKFNTPEENLIIEKQEEKAFQERELLLQDMSKKLGYEMVNSVEALALTPNEMSKIRNVDLRYYLREKDTPLGQKMLEPIRYLKAQRKDGASVKVVILIRNDLNNNEFAAEIFTPAFYEGSGGNHDFNRSELEQNLRMAIDLPPYSSPR